MKINLTDFDPEAPIIVLDVGNSRISIGGWVNAQLRTPLDVDIDDRKGFQEAFRAQVGSFRDGKVAAVAVASVVPDTSIWIREFVEESLQQNTLEVGKNVDVPIDLDLSDRITVGMDRICAAAAAYDTVQSGCVVVDFGSAVTVDLVNDDGVFMGGAILPGVRMQLRALHEFTAVLPDVEPGMPELAYGRNTIEAIQNGVCRGITGSVRTLVESYATSLDRWPQVIGTGGDLDMLADHCDYLDTRVRHLTLRGVGVAYRKHLEAHGV